MLHFPRASIAPSAARLLRFARRGKPFQSRPGLTGIGQAEKAARKNQGQGEFALGTVGVRTL
jgi:hypothetical protein